MRMDMWKLIWVPARRGKPGTQLDMPEMKGTQPTDMQQPELNIFGSSKMRGRPILNHGE